MPESFRCDNCGRDWPREQLKEVFSESDGHEEKQSLCPECLDRRMNEASEVYGVEGEEKRAAAYVSDQPDHPPGEDVTGRREGSDRDRGTE